MRWLEASGWQFGYPKLARYAHAALPTERQHLFTYTSHISLPTPTAKAHAFREDVRMYGWEDVEWGMRLCASGVPLFYEPSARALHHHHIELPQSLERMRTLFFLFFSSIIVFNFFGNFVYQSIACGASSFKLIFLNS